MSLGAREIEALVRELQPLVGARVDAVRQHAERALTLELHGRAGTVLLLLSAEPDVTRIHVVTRRPPQPDRPFAAQATLRRALEGARLAALAVVPGDRVVALDLAKGDGDLRLVAELTGRHGNLFLLDAAGIVRASAGRNLSQRRELVPGRAWIAPAPPPAAAVAGAERHERRARDGAGARPEGGDFPLSAEVERRYAEREEARALAEGRRRLREPLRAALARARRALERLAEEAARVPAADADRRAADLLKQNLRRVRRGQREVTLVEWSAEGAQEVTLQLDPALSPQQNMERRYRRYRRIVESAARVEARAAEVRAREGALRSLLDAVDGASREALQRLEREARVLAAGPRAEPAATRRRREEAPLPYRSFRSVAGVAILVGRGAAENDALTLRHARGNDAWLHARGIPGAHVVVRLTRGQAPDQETLLDAAHLAAHFSDARGEPACDVAWTRARFVRKPKGSAPGAVTFSQERVIPLRIEPRRIDRLLADEEGAPP